MSEARINGRHCFASTRNRARALVVGPVLTVAAVGGLALSSPASAASSWEDLRRCESGGNYATNTGNGYYGAYQMSLPTWKSLGYSGLPSDAAPATQDRAARELAQRSGFGQWPVCGQGMGADDLGSPVATTIVPAHASRSAERADTAPAPVGTRSGSVPFFTTSMIDQVREDVRSWQAKLNTHGYDIAVDGQYGPESAGAARDFQIAKDLLIDGIVGPQTWAATFG
jgi:hypothetical protein